MKSKWDLRATRETFFFNINYINMTCPVECFEKQLDLFLTSVSSQSWNLRDAAAAASPVLSLYLFIQAVKAVKLFCCAASDLFIGAFVQIHFGSAGFFLLQMQK